MAFIESLPWEYSDKIWQLWVVAPGSCAHLWLHGHTLDSGHNFVLSLPLETQGNSGRRGHHGVTGCSHLLREGPA